jgi:hypothetical protein
MKKGFILLLCLFILLLGACQSPASSTYKAYTPSSYQTHHPTSSTFNVSTLTPAWAVDLSNLIPLPTSPPLEILSVTSPVSAGSSATLKAKTIPNAVCDIDVIYKSGSSSASGLGIKIADANGNVSWTWKVGTRTTPGSWNIIVTVSSGGMKTTKSIYFTVT